MNIAIADIVRFLVVLGLVIVFHEFGHLVIAKMAGARVNRFSIGFGRRLFGFTWRGTEYMVSALPLGGYVKIAGMEPDEELTGAPWEFLSLPAWKQISVVCAGPAMNFVLAVLIYYVLFMAAGEPVITTSVVGLVRDGGVGWEIGLHPGDRILAVEGKPVSTWTDLAELIPVDQQEEIVLTVEREGRRLEKQLPPPPSIRPLESTLSEEKLERRLDIEGLLVRTVQGDSPASKAGLQPGCVITAVNGEPLTSDRELAKRISQQFTRDPDGAYRPKPLTLAWIDLDNDRVQAEVIPNLFFPAEDAEPYHPKSRIGIVFTPEKDVRDILIPFHPRLDIAPKLEPIVGVAKEGGPAQSAGLVTGCRIIEVNGTPIDDWNALVDIVLSSYAVEGEEARGVPLEMTWVTPDEQVRTATITPRVRKQTLPSRRGLRKGEQVYVAQLEMSRKAERIRYGVLGAIPRSLEKLRDDCSMMFYFLYKVITLEYSTRNLGGPVAIAQLAAESGRWGLEKYFSFIALLSANLAILNLFPIPPLDGGHVVLYCFQWLRRRPVTLKQMENFAKVGIVLIIPLMLYLFWNDLERVGLFTWMRGLLESIWP